MIERRLPYLSFLFLILISCNSFAQLSFAILPIGIRGSISVEDREAAESALYQHLIESGKYRIIERSRIKQILEEQRLQSSGATDQDKAVEIGKILGVDKLITSNMYMKGSNYAINFTVIDIATAQVEYSFEESSSNHSASSHGRFCAADIIERYSLIGKILGKSGDIYVVNLGTNHGLAEGDRLFVARNELLKGDDGSILFQEYKRLGTLQVTKLNPARAQAQVKHLLNSSIAFQKDDLISPEPIPKKDPVKSTTKLIDNITKGALLLDDDMKKKKWLSPASNLGEAYINGKLHLNAGNLTSGHAYCFYPVPFDKLENFIMEGEVTFTNITDKYNKINVVFRSDGKYGGGDTYSFYWHDEGEFGIYKFRTGNVFKLLPLQACPALHRGEATNTFRIEALGPQFQFYINDIFLIAVEDEYFEKGYVGFWADSKCYSIIDNVKIWEAIQN